MRTIFRTLINGALILAAAGTELWLSRQRVFLHASRDTRIAMCIGVAAAFFAVACLALRALKAKEKTSHTSPYAIFRTPAKGRK